MSRTILVIGGTGMLGRALVQRLENSGRPVAAPRRADLDVTDPVAVAAAVQAITPGAVFNASAWSDVGRAEDPGLCDAVYGLNRDAPGILARTCREAGVPLTHVSTDYVFDGRAARPYREDDPTGPLQVYGLSKLEGEQAVLRAGADALVVRVSTLYGPAVDRPRLHYVDAILTQARQKKRIEVVRPPVSSPTYAPDVAEALLALREAGASGLVHFVNDGGCSRLELAAATVRAAGMADRVAVVERPEPPSDLARPAYSVLDTRRFAALTGRTPRPWQDALAEYVGAAAAG